ncbi:ABC-type multidrug transport system ATPase subunit [Nakamurella sp. UYEF19]|uniref:ATP-binding cassette domain-containing protein n=1 Tax=Nakamurella sp. UYEF19 TaxID=1756392 RepID=UPI00339B7C77
MTAGGGDRKAPEDSVISWDLVNGVDAVVGRRGGPAEIQLDGVDIELQHARLRWNGEYLDIRSLAPRLRPIVRSVPVLQARVGPTEQFMIGHGTFQVSPVGQLLLMPRGAKAGEARLRLRGVTLQYRTANEPTTRDISFDLGSNEVLAVIGPSGAGKSTLCGAFTGGVNVVAGRLFLGGIDLSKAGDQLMNLVSFVPQHPDLYAELGVRQSLLLVSRLRLAADLPSDERARRVEDVIEQVQLGKDAEKSAGSLSGGQKKRLSIAMELLSDPMLLVLDEPTSGLDEGLDRNLMRLLRDIAGRGCAVVVVTHSMVNLDQADIVLAVAAGGHRGFLGPPSELLTAFGAQDYATVMDRLRQGRAVGQVDNLTSLPALASGSVPSTPGATSSWRQFSTLLMREFARQRAVLKSIIRTAVLYPIIVVALTYSAASHGYSVGQSPGGARAAALILIVCLTFFSMSLSFSSIVADRVVLVREARWGISAYAVLMSRMLAFTPVALWLGLSSVLGTLLVVPGSDRPLLPGPTGILIVGCLVPLTAVSVGLLVSTVAADLRQAVFVLMGLLAAEVVLTGLAIPFPPGTSGDVLRMVSTLVPTRWAASALGSELDLNAVPTRTDSLSPSPSGLDAIWSHDLTHFWTAVGVLGCGTLLLAVLASLVLSQQLRRRS